MEFKAGETETKWRSYFCAVSKYRFHRRTNHPHLHAAAGAPWNCRPAKRRPTTEPVGGIRAASTSSTAPYGDYLLGKCDKSARKGPRKLSQCYDGTHSRKSRLWSNEKVSVSVRSCKFFPRQLRFAALFQSLISDGNPLRCRRLRRGRVRAIFLFHFDIGL